jgi:hypothetical protein
MEGREGRMLGEVQLRNPTRGAMTAKHPRQKGPKRSLNSRKREKDVSGAVLDNCFRPEKVEFKKANWESAVPRKMQIIMGAAAHAAAGTSRQSKGPREDLPRDPSQSKRSKAARAAEKAAKAAAPALPLSGQKAAPAPLPTAAPTAPTARAVLVPDEPKAEASRAAPKKPETAAMEAERLRTDAHALGAALSARNQSHRKAAKPVGFGSTNAAPPELKVKGRFGRLAAEATARRPPRAEPTPAHVPARRCCCHRLSSVPCVSLALQGWRSWRAREGDHQAADPGELRRCQGPAHDARGRAQQGGARLGRLLACR